MRGAGGCGGRGWIWTWQAGPFSEDIARGKPNLVVSDSSSLTYVLQPLTQSRVKYYVALKRLVDVTLVTKLRYAQTLRYVVIPNPYQLVTRKTLFLILRLMC